MNICRVVIWDGAMGYSAGFHDEMLVSDRIWHFLRIVYEYAERGGVNMSNASAEVQVLNAEV